MDGLVLYFNTNANCPVTGNFVPQKENSRETFVIPAHAGARPLLLSFVVRVSIIDRIPVDLIF